MHLRPSTFTFLVGKNDAGKSSVLHAVNLALKLQAEISAQLFYDVAEAITFILYVSNYRRNLLGENMSDKVFKVIKSNIKSILQTDHFSDWLSKEKVEKDDLIFFNNSYIFRQNFKTNKSDKVLGIKVDKNGKTTSSEIYVTNELNFNTDFKRISHKSSNIPKIEELNVVIKKEMEYK